jgi:hypothetical protein
MAQAQENPLNKHIVEPLVDFTKKGLQFLEKVRLMRAPRPPEPGSLLLMRDLPAINQPPNPPLFTVRQAKSKWYDNLVTIN